MKKNKKLENEGTPEIMSKTLLSNSLYPAHTSIGSESPKYARIYTDFGLSTTAASTAFRTEEASKTVQMVVGLMAAAFIAGILTRFGLGGSR